MLSRIGTNQNSANVFTNRNTKTMDKEKREINSRNDKFDQRERSSSIGWSDKTMIGIDEDN